MMQTAPTTPAPIAPPEGEHFWVEDDGEHVKLVVRTEGGAAVWVWFFGFALVLGWQIISSPLGLFTAVLGLFVTLTLIHALNALMGLEVLRIGHDTILYEQRVVVPIKRRCYPRSSCGHLRVYCDEAMRKPHNNLLHFTLDHGSLRLDTPRGLLSVGASLAKDEANAICAFLLTRFPDLGERA